MIYNTIAAGSSIPSYSSTNFTAGGEEALAALIAQLLSGGTAEQKASKVDRNKEITSVRGTRGDYTKEAAFLDAQGAVAQQSRLAMEKLIPSLTRSAEGAGTSQNSMRALLLQDAANKAAESSAALGLKASVDYGGINANLSSILQSLTQETDPVTKALLEAINLSKGQSSTGATTVSSGLPTVSYDPGTNWSRLLGSSSSNAIQQETTPRMWSSGNSGWSDISNLSGNNFANSYLLTPNQVNAFLNGSYANNSGMSSWSGTSF